MYENDFMYAVERSPEYLAHYGIRGMKWGVRKAIKSGNSARLSKQYAKASKKLAKLEKRAANTGKYARRAALMGAGAAAAGGLAALGTSGVNRVLNKGGAALSKGGAAVGKGLNKAGYAVGKFGNSIGAGAVTGKINRGLNLAGAAVTKGSKAANAGLYKAGFGVTKWGTQNTIGKSVGDALIRQGAKGTAAAVKSSRQAVGLAATKIVNGKRIPATGITTIGDYASKSSYKMGQAATKAGIFTKGLSNNTIARIGAGAVGAGLAAGAAKNAYRAATAKKKAERFRSEMNKAFAGTKYANGGQPRQGKKRRRK